MTAGNALFDLTLNKEIRGTSDLKNPVCEFHYNWDFERNTGIAMLRSINGSPVNITLHPLGIEGQLDFMSDMIPTRYSVNASNDKSIALIEIVIYRVILDVDGEKRTAAIMLGENGENIIGTDGFLEDSAAKQLPKVVFEKQDAPEGVEPPTAG